ncbi:MAG: hypothetical protein VB031_02380 [Eubacteriaceae bacterium]|nr:hypothetical protein [Eubacteriaceae bacterium]
MLTSNTRGPDHCEKCGAPLRWIRLLTGSWIACDPKPVIYMPGAGKQWLVEGVRRDAEILKDCKIYKRGDKMDREQIKTGYTPHAWTCGEGRRIAP